MIIKKYDLIHSLKNVKLVLGNGFDLHCGLKSSFYHYYHFFKDKIDIIENWYNRFKKNFNEHFTTYVDPAVEIKRCTDITIWDCFFTILAIERHREKYRDYLWADVERDITLSMLDVKHATTEEELKQSIETQLLNPINWDLVFDDLNATHLNSDVMVRAISQIISAKINETITSVDSFYSYLLEELKTFEKHFASFLKLQLVDTTYSNFGIINENTVYFNKAVETIKTICGFNNLVSIESFNYTYIKDEQVLPLFLNINGNIESPIFGIDSVLKPSNPKFIFTKTSRRMENDGLNSETKGTPSFENIIIYGHSLNEADYSYFFPIFDEINIGNASLNSKIVFAYSIFDETNREKLLETLRNNIFKMLEKYFDEKEKKTTNRLLDGLTTRSRILLYEIPIIDKDKYPKTQFDEMLERIERI